MRFVSVLSVVFLFCISGVSAQANPNLDLAEKLIANELNDVSAYEAFDCLTLSTVKNDVFKKNEALKEFLKGSNVLELGTEIEGRVWKRVFMTKASSERLQQADIVSGSELLMLSKSGKVVAKANEEGRIKILSSCSSMLGEALVVVKAKLELMSRDSK